MFVSVYDQENNEWRSSKDTGTKMEMKGKEMAE